MLYELFVVSSDGKILFHLDLTREGKSYLLKKEKLMLDLINSLSFLSKELVRGQADRISINELCFYITTLFEHKLVIVADQATYLDTKFVKEILEKYVKKEGTLSLSRRGIQQIREEITKYQSPPLHSIIKKLYEAASNCIKSRETLVKKSQEEVIDNATIMDVGKNIDEINLIESSSRDIINLDLYYRPNKLIPKALYIIKNEKNPPLRAFALLAIIKAWECDCPTSINPKIKDVYNIISSLNDGFLKDIFEHKMETYVSIIKVSREEDTIKLANRLLLKLKEDFRTLQYKDFIEAYINDYYHGIPLPNKIIEGDEDLKEFYELKTKLKRIPRSELLRELLPIIGTIKVKLSGLFRKKGKENLIISYFDLLSELLPLIYSYKQDEPLAFDLIEDITERVFKNRIEKVIELRNVSFKNKFDALSKILSIYTLHSIEHMHSKDEFEWLLEITNKTLQQYSAERKNVIIKPLNELAIKTTLWATKSILEKILGKQTNMSGMAESYLKILENLTLIEDNISPKIKTRALQILTNLSILIDLNCRTENLLGKVINELEKITSAIKFKDFSYFVIDSTISYLMKVSKEFISRI